MLYTLMFFDNFKSIGIANTILKSVKLLIFGTKEEVQIINKIFSYFWGIFYIRYVLFNFIF